ncbi:hypothetical protein N0V93_010350 [Gnomoniopsis smithogilvyi]|uniref:Uncharacterized protein n=1 Tax=Gnomoniopsis smithogilvyi TaxID=1191159 RepID=A0A9W9CRR0_9PEZI|nr:hypothetical protein N0V93_010350 [Gnomoniopsis smithogilvyi]
MAVLALRHKIRTPRRQRCAEEERVARCISAFIPPATALNASLTEPLWEGEEEEEKEEEEEEEEEEEDDEEEEEEEEEA